jgi:hypothetical protein
LIEDELKREGSKMETKDSEKRKAREINYGDTKDYGTLGNLMNFCCDNRYCPLCKGRISDDVDEQEVVDIMFIHFEKIHGIDMIDDSIEIESCNSQNITIRDANQN